VNAARHCSSDDIRRDRVDRRRRLLTSLVDVVICRWPSTSVMLH
jgi:hypothetical protein